MHIPSGYQYSFYHDIRNNCERAFLMDKEGNVHAIHGVVVNKLCQCKQGVEIRIHATESKPESEVRPIIDVNE